MFTYWPFVSLVVMGVMVTILLLLKFADKICRARMTATEGFVERQYDDDQVKGKYGLSFKVTWTCFIGLMLDILTNCVMCEIKVNWAKTKRKGEKYFDRQ